MHQQDKYNRICHNTCSDRADSIYLQDNLKCKSGISKEQNFSFGQIPGSYNKNNYQLFFCEALAKAFSLA